MWFKSATIVRTLPFAIYILFLALNNSLALLLSLVIQDIRWIYGVRVGVVALILAWFWRQYSELSHLNQSSIAIKSTLNLQSYAISLAVGVMVFVAWIAPYPAWAMMSAVNEGFNPISADGQGIDIPLALTRIAGAALFACIPTNRRRILSPHCCRNA